MIADTTKQTGHTHDLIRCEACAIRGVDTAYDVQPLAFACVDHVEGGAGVHLEDVAHLELLLHETALVDPSNLHIPCSDKLSACAQF